jgi:hypothetical protein
MGVSREVFFGKPIGSIAERPTEMGLSCWCIDLPKARLIPLPLALPGACGGVPQALVAQACHPASPPLWLVPYSGPGSVHGGGCGEGRCPTPSARLSAA